MYRHSLATWLASILLRLAYVLLLLACVLLLLHDIQCVLLLTCIVCHHILSSRAGLWCDATAVKSSRQGYQCLWSLNAWLPVCEAIQLPWLHISAVVHSEITDVGSPAFMAWRLTVAWLIHPQKSTHRDLLTSEYYSATITLLLLHQYCSTTHFH